MSISEEKAALRAHFLALRNALDTQQKRVLDEALCREITNHSAFLQAELLLCYAPVRGEPNLTSVYQAALECGKRIAFPRCEGKQMTFHEIRDLSQLQAGRFGIPTPPEDTREVHTNAHTLCLLPALSATRQGVRLGYGGGFYDRFLPDFKGTALLAIYECLLTDDLPCEATDISADHILTEKGELLPHA